MSWKWQCFIVTAQNEKKNGIRINKYVMILQNKTENSISFNSRQVKSEITSLLYKQVKKNRKKKIICR